MTWDGDISKMGQLARNVGRLAGVPARASKQVTVDIGQMIEEEFQRGQDPYGNTWKPLAEATLARRSQTSEPPLTDFGDMRRSVDVRPMSGAGVSISIDHPSEDHQTGWTGSQGTGPARPILPGGTFPARWKAAIDGAVKSQVQESLR